MDKTQQVTYSNSTKTYIQQMKLRPLFYSLTKLLSEAQPADPIKYLIQHLENSKRKRLIYIQGFDHAKCSELSSSVANKFNFKFIDIASILKTKDINTVSDDKINNTFKEAMDKVESVYKGVIISGYPNNLIQANFMQQNAFLPERIFMLPYDNVSMEKHYIAEGHTAQDVALMITRDNLNLSELMEILKDVPDWLPQSPQKQTDIINSTLKVRDKKVFPLEVPRILVIHPPYLLPPAIQDICERYCINLVSLEKAFIHLKNRKQDYQKYVRKHQNLSNELQLALIQTQSTSVVSKNKGLMLCGWPTDVKMFAYTQQHFINPHIILVFTDDKEKLLRAFEALDASDSNLFPIKDKPTVEQYKAELQQYDKLVAEAKKSQRTQNYIFSEQPKEIMRSFESLIANPKLYC